MDSFDKLYYDNYNRMYRIAVKMVGDTDSASDIVQEVFICLFDKLKSGYAILCVGSWLYKATFNKCCDNIKKQKKFGSLDLVKNYEIEDEPIENKETKEVIQQALSSLKPQERILMVLYSEGLSYKEIAEVSGTKSSSIGKTISRTLEKLGKKLKTFHYELY